MREGGHSTAGKAGANDRLRCAAGLRAAAARCRSFARPPPHLQLSPSPSCSVGATIFYALGLSAIMIGVHASLRLPDDTTLFADEAPAAGSGMSGLLDMFKPKNPLVAYATGA